MEMNKYGYKSMTHYTRDIVFLRTLFGNLVASHNRLKCLDSSLTRVEYRGTEDRLVSVLFQIRPLLERGKSLEYVASILTNSRSRWKRRVADELRSKLVKA